MVVLHQFSSIPEKKCSCSSQKDRQQSTANPHAGQEPPPIDATYTSNEFQHWKRFKWRVFKSSSWAQRQESNPIRCRSNLSVSAKLAVILQTCFAIFWMNHKMPCNMCIYITHVVYIYRYIRMYIVFSVHGFPPSFTASTARRKPSLARSLSRASSGAWFAIPSYQCHRAIVPSHASALDTNKRTTYHQADQTRNVETIKQ